MKRGFICLLIVGLTYAVEDNVGAETKDTISTKGTNINFYYDKSKRGATKITNADSPSFNYLTSSNSVSNSGSTGFKPVTTTSTVTNAAPARYVYNQQYYQPNPYLTYVQYPQAAQIAAQYSFQSNPVAHFLQTPTQIQYVAAPTVAQVPQIKYQEYSSSNAAGSETSATSTSSQYVPQSQSGVSSSQYVPQSQSGVSSSQYVPQSQSGVSSSQYVSQSQSGVSSSQSYVSGAQTSASISQAKQVPLYSGYQSVQPVFYQQPLFTYFAQPQAANFIYQQPNANLLLKQQQLAGFYGANKFGLYTPTQNTQLAYTIVPMTVTSSIQDSTSTTSDLKTSDKALSNAQQTSSTSSFNYGTKG